MPIATSNPAIPPPMASRMLSTSACVTICRREAPMASLQRRLPTPRDRAGEQQVRNVGARDEEDQAAHAEENLEAAAVLLLHDADAGACGHDGNDLPRQILDDVRHPVRRVSRVVLQPLMKDVR